MDLETTSQIPRDELLGLLNTMTPHDQQRITAEFVAVGPPAELKITFRKPKHALTPARIAVIGASFVLSFGIGVLAAIL
jgi:hypothetical protein